jgi:copper chaperone CopZ
MNKYILGIDGMGCGMCEIHVEDAVRKNMNIKKAKASHLKNNLIVFSETVFTIDDFKNALDQTGYRITSFERTVAVRRLWWWR